jgi:hypothetical protein
MTCNMYRIVPTRCLARCRDPGAGAMNRTSKVGVLVPPDPSLTSEIRLPPSFGGRFVTTRLSWSANE